MTLGIFAYRILASRRIIVFLDTFRFDRIYDLQTFTPNPRQMITRIWHGRTALKNAASYLQFLLHEGTREYLQTPGNLSVKVWQRMDADCCHFWTVTEWTDIEAIKRFAGEDYDKAKYYPEDEGILLEFEERVEHCESFVVRG